MSNQLLPWIIWGELNIIATNGTLFPWCCSQALLMMILHLQLSNSESERDRKPSTLSMTLPDTASLNRFKAFGENTWSRVVKGLGYWVHFKRFCIIQSNKKWCSRQNLTHPDPDSANARRGQCSKLSQTFGQNAATDFNWKMFDFLQQTFLQKAWQAQTLTTLICRDLAWANVERTPPLKWPYQAINQLAATEKPRKNPRVEAIGA